jgi:hypothetical protein
MIKQQLQENGMEMFRVSLVKILILVSISILLSACSSTSLTSRWNDPNYGGPAFTNIMVIGIFKDETRRRHFETEFARLMTSQERTGLTSFNDIPELKEADEKEELIAVVNKAGADAVLIVTFEGVTKEQREVPPSIDYVPTMGIGYGMYGYYGMGHTAVYRPGYTVTDKVVRLDIKLFDTASEKLIWAGKSESFNPSSSQAIINELAKLVIDDMKKSGILK